MFTAKWGVSPWVLTPLCECDGDPERDCKAGKTYHMVLNVKLGLVQVSKTMRLEKEEGCAGTG